MKKLIVLQHIEREGPGLFAKVAKQKGFEINIFRLDQGAKLPELNKDDLVVIMGGPMSVNDINKSKYHWLKKEVEFIKKALERGLKVIGICLGAQLMAYACGGKVTKLKKGFPLKESPEIGWEAIYSSKINNDILQDFFKEPKFVLHWHSERIILPSCAKLIASSKYCTEQLFKLNNSSYGLQFHIETNDEIVKKWIREDKEFIRFSLGEKGPEEIRKQNDIYSPLTLKWRISLIKKLIEI